MDYDTAWNRIQGADQFVAVAVSEETCRQLEFSHDIREKLEIKAQTTLSVALLTVTLATGFGVSLAPRLGELLPQHTHVYLALGSIAALLIGLVSVLFALRAFRAAPDIRQVRYEEVFSEEGLQSPLEWHRRMAVHLYSVTEEQEQLNEKRAWWVQWAMRLLGVHFVALFLVVSAVILLLGFVR